MKLFSVPSQTEWALFVAIFIAIGIFIAIAEFLRRKFHGSPEITRKLVHILTGVLIFFAPRLFTSGIPALLLALSFIAVNFAAIQFGLLKGMHGTHRHTYGTVYYPLAFFILVLLYWETAPFIVSVAILILAISDAAAAIVGENLRHPHEYRLTSDKKSLEGSAVMFTATFIIIVAVLPQYGLDAASMSMALGAAAISLYVTGWEAISSKGFDNFTVPLSAALMPQYFFAPLPHHDPDQMIAAVVLSLCVALFSLRFKFLSQSGSAATFLLATVIFGLGGWKWTVPVLVFFVVSSLLSKFGKTRKQKLEAVFDKTDKRDEGQVAANGGVAGIIVLLWYIFPGEEYLYLLYLTSLAAVTADTWGTEIGTLSGTKPVSIVSFKPVEPGTSGGVSLIGFAGGAVGAALIVLSGWLMDAHAVSSSAAVKIIVSGMFGAIVDSVCGATLQAQYQTEEGQSTEKEMYRGKPTVRVRGIKWINNDIVNWMCAISGSLAMYFLL